MGEARYCLECGDEFRYDDTGGYNPPCRGCGLCLDCCGAGGQFSCHDDDVWGDDWDEDEDEDLFTPTQGARP